VEKGITPSHALRAHGRGEGGRSPACPRGQCRDPPTQARPARAPGRRPGGTSKHPGCGDGRIDCDKSLQILKQRGFRGWIMADEWEVPDPYDACLKCQPAIDAVGRS
jgi:hypothetical protein